VHGIECQTPPEHENRLDVEVTNATCPDRDDVHFGRLVCVATVSAIEYDSFAGGSLVEDPGESASGGSTQPEVPANPASPHRKTDDMTTRPPRTLLLTFMCCSFSGRPQSNGRAAGRWLAIREEIAARTLGEIVRALFEHCPDGRGHTSTARISATRCAGQPKPGHGSGHAEDQADEFVRR
jgi:hypothetical protein